jgi:hypothetical protein
MYARTRLTFADIARLGSVEDWRDHHGRPLTGRSIATLIRNEALIGNFVWGRGKQPKSLVTRDPSRHDGCIPRLIDGETWARIQARAALAIENKNSGALGEKLRRALERNSLLVSRDFRAHGLPDRASVCARLGPWADCLKSAGQDPAELKKRLITQARQHRSDAREFAGTLTRTLVEDGHIVAYDARMSVLHFHELRIRLRFLWPTLGEVGRVWRIRVDTLGAENDFDLLVRMEERSRAMDFFLVPPADVVIRFPQCLIEKIPSDLARFRCQSPEQLLERIEAFSARSDLPR